MKKIFTIFLTISLIFSFIIGVRAEGPVSIFAPLDGNGNNGEGMTDHGDKRHEVFISFEEDLSTMETPYAGVWALNVQGKWGNYITVNGIKINDTKIGDNAGADWEFVLHFDGGKDGVKGLRLFSHDGYAHSLDHTKANTIILDKDLPLEEGTLGKTITMTYDPAKSVWVDSSPVEATTAKPSSAATSSSAASATAANSSSAAATVSSSPKASAAVSKSATPGTSATAVKSNDKDGKNNTPYIVLGSIIGVAVLGIVALIVYKQIASKRK